MADNSLQTLKMNGLLVLLLLSPDRLQLFCFNRKRGLSLLRLFLEIDGGRFPRLDSMGSYVMVCDAAQPQVLRFELLH